MSKAPRVLFLSSLWPPRVLGGAEIYASRLASELAARGSETGAVTLGVEGEDVVGQIPAWPYALDEWAGKPRWQRGFFQLIDLYHPTASARLKEAIERFRPDVVHSHSIAGMSASVLGTPSRMGVRHVHTIHDYWLLCRRSGLFTSRGDDCERACSSCKVVSQVRRRTLARNGPNVFITVSQAVANQHVARGMSQDEIVVLPNPTDAQALSVPPRNRPAKTFGYIGTLTRHKGIELLLDSFRQLESPDLRLIVAGRGPLEGVVSQASDTRVEFRGWVNSEEKKALFAEMDCLVVPSLWRDPAPLVVHEAVVAGLPVIGSNRGGIPELVPQENRSLLFSPTAPEGLASSMRNFLAEPLQYAPRTRTVPTWEEHVETLLRIYRPDWRGSS